MGKFLTDADDFALREDHQKINSLGRGHVPIMRRQRHVGGEGGGSGAGAMALGIVTVGAAERQDGGGSIFDGLTLTGPCADALGNEIGKAELCGTVDAEDNPIELDIVSAQNVTLKVGFPVLIIFRGEFDSTLTYPAVYVDVEDYLQALPDWDDNAAQALYHLPGEGLRWGGVACP